MGERNLANVEQSIKQVLPVFALSMSGYDHGTKFGRHEKLNLKAREEKKEKETATLP